MPIISFRKELLWSITLCMFLELATSIELLELDVPKSIAFNTSVVLSCHWQLDPAEVLYSVKWYKDGKEFFRHVPRDVEPRRKFPLPGVDVEDSDTSGSRLVLSPATLDSGGRYRCEVSGERPLFATVSDHADMTVIVSPEHGPVISGFNSNYRIGDRVKINCTSGHSQPATQLSWYINGDRISTEEYTSSYRSENSLIVTSLMLDLEVTEMHFRKNVLKVKCLATITFANTPVYWQSTEESAFERKSRVPYHIETETTSIADHRVTRADRVPANASVSNFLGNICKFMAFFSIVFVNYFDLNVC